MDIPPPPSSTSPGAASPGVAESPIDRPWPSPLTYAEGQTRVNQTRVYGWAVVDKICSGSVCPPPETLAPELIKRMKELDVVRDGFDAMVRKGAGKATMPDKLRLIAWQRAQAVINEADRIWGAAKAEDKRIKDKLSFGVDLLKLGLIVGGIFGAAAVVSHVASTSRNVRIAVRGYPQ